MLSQKLLSLLFQRKKDRKRNTRAQPPLPNTQHFSFTLSSPCHLSSTLSVQCISSWRAKGTASTPGECFLCRMTGVFVFSCPRDGFERGSFALTHKKAPDKTFGVHRLSGNCWTEAERLLPREKKRQKRGKNSKQNVWNAANAARQRPRLDWLVADLISCDVPSSPHLMFSAPSTESSSTRIDVAMLLHSASKQSARIEKHWPVTEACTCNLLPVSCNCNPLDNGEICPPCFYPHNIYAKCPASSKCRPT